ncbi:hypothetical protein GCM10011572_12560 [Pseudoduganella buxea]|uniref:Uncharacterized protein n=1 Tax=Pseudoduganella buxea TaxID=1949069 RepID=A0ABQ1KBZ0_9BURK|nr:hypothetical protein GCM10011572_12560 [Pseudoduganella buxea]
MSTLGSDPDKTQAQLQLTVEYVSVSGSDPRTDTSSSALTVVCVSTQGSDPDKTQAQLQLTVEYVSVSGSDPIGHGPIHDIVPSIGSGHQPELAFLQGAVIVTAQAAVPGASSAAA